MTKILITGYIGLYNVGDEAILSGVVNSLNKYIDNANFSVVTNNPNETKELHNVTPVFQSFKRGIGPFIKNQITKREMLQVYHAIDNCDVFILGGGELLQDLNPYNLPILLSLMYLAHKKKKKTVIYGMGAGPIESKFGKKLCKNILKNVDLITVRDKKSKIALENCGLSNVIQTADPAFAIDLPDKSTINNILNEMNFINRENIISATLHNLLYNDDLYRKSKGAHIDLTDRRKKMANLYEYVLESDKRLMFLSTVKKDRDNYVKINKFFHNKDISIIPDYYSDVRYVLSLLSISDMLIGMRLHSLIFATMLGIPFIPISYCEKVKNFLEMINLGNLYVDIEEIDELDFDERIYSNFFEVWHNKPKYSNLLIENSNKLKDKAFENAKLVADII